MTPEEIEKMEVWFCEFLRETPYYRSILFNDDMVLGHPNGAFAEFSKAGILEPVHTCGECGVAVRVYRPTERGLMLIDILKLEGA